MALLRVDWNPSEKKIRQFGGLLALFAFLAAGSAWRKGRPEAAWLLAGGGAALGSACAAILPLGRRLYRAWMGVAFVIGSAVSAGLLFVLYYGIVTPIGLVFRLIGRDALGLGSEGGRWIPLNIPDDKADFERLY